MRQAFFITGTDTDAGKTLVATALLAKARQHGLSTLGLKPIAAGSELIEGSEKNRDAHLLQQQSSVVLPYAQINPVLLREAIAPHIAARHENKRLSVSKLVGFVRGALLNPVDFAVVEGAGGWLVPLNEQETMGDFARALQMPVILVVGLKLGCLNHALLTQAQIQRQGLVLAGWVASKVDPDMPEQQANIETLQQCLAAPCLGVLPNLSSASAENASQYITSDLFNLAENIA